MLSPKFNFRTYITSGSNAFNWNGSMSFCQSQHSKGLVTFDTEEKFLDVKYIVGPNGENSQSHTALYNPTGFRCTTSATCDSMLVRFMNSIFNCIYLYEYAFCAFRDGNQVTRRILHSRMECFMSNNTFVAMLCFIISF